MTHRVYPVLSVLLWSTLAGCGAKTSDKVGGETNWLTACAIDADCGVGSCLCGTCTRECSDDDACRGVAQSVCSVNDPIAHTAACSDEPEAPICLRPSEPAEMQAPTPISTAGDGDRFGFAMALGDDGSIYVTGGQDAFEFDLGVEYRNYWAARYSDVFGAKLWEVIIDPEDDPVSMGQDIAVAPDGTVTTLNVVWGEPLRSTLRRYSPEGEPLERVDIENRAGVLGILSDGSVLLAGQDRDSLADAWVGVLDEQMLMQTETVRGLPGGYSFAASLAWTEDDDYFVGGALGTSDTSNGSDAWLAAGTVGQPLSWQATLASGSTGTTHALAVTPDGGVLAAGYGETENVVARYAPDGERLWREPLPQRPEVALATVDGYFIGYQGQSDFASDPRIRLEYRNWDRELLWRMTDTGCGVRDLALFDGALIVLSNCDGDMVLEQYEL